MASRQVKSAMSEKKMDRVSYPAKGAKVRAAMTPSKEERGKKDTRKVKRVLASGR